jgi:N,N'-diacetyllegionaminate synthase|tara:strand:- start:3130 stop:4152 length:1023 start_codon:yes stop_codon:yes gene_type:complete
VKKIGNMNRVIIIAEAGVNHNGKLKLAYKLVDVAKKCGADFIKFQTSIPELHISKFAKKANYQKKNTPGDESQLQMCKKITLSYEEFRKLKKYCKKKKIEFLSTPFDLKSIDFLKSLKMKYFKIPSGEITNLPYLIKVAKLKKKVILSTGMANLLEIKEALKILISNGTKKKNITVLQCNTEYPTPLRDANVRAMLTIKKKFKVNIGYSDHTEGIEAPLVAVALGAKVIEKHITLNKNLFGPDHKASITSKELKKMVEGIRKVTVVLGNGVKKVSPSEGKNIKISRPSIVAAKEIKKGEKFTSKNLTIKRPGNGISPMKLFKVIGKIAKRRFLEDELIKL